MAKEHFEIERRWLLKNLPLEDILRAPSTKQAHFVTVYIINDPRLEMRIRRREFDAVTDYLLVAKIGSGLKRQESPKLEGDAELFDYYLKKRHCAYLDKNHWEVKLPSGLKLELSYFWRPSKVYELVLAEIEFKSEETARQFSINELPLEIRKLIVKEVTEDPRYNGKNLAVHGRPNPE